MLKKVFKRFLIGLVVVAALLVLLPPLLHPTGLPDEPVSGPSIKVYGANVWGVRGYFAIHTWIATRAEGESQYRIDQVIGWRLRRTGSARVTHIGTPNDPWFGNEAILLHEVSGTAAAELLPKVRSAIRNYPYSDRYTMFPGPNSNSFTEWVALQVPELGLELPTKAIGRLWMRSDADAP